MTKRESLKMALEALETWSDCAMDDFVVPLYRKEDL